MKYNIGVSVDQYDCSQQYHHIHYHQSDYYASSVFSFSIIFYDIPFLHGIIVCINSVTLITTYILHVLLT